MTLDVACNRTSEVHPEMFKANTALGSFAIYDNPLGCVSGVEHVEEENLDSTADYMVSTKPHVVLATVPSTLSTTQITTLAFLSLSV